MFKDRDMKREDFVEVKKALETRNDVYYTALIPGLGKCDTQEGEMLRAINKIIYRYWNDGDYFFQGYGCETAGPAHSYLVGLSILADELSPKFREIEFKYGHDYEIRLYEVLEVILDYIDSKNGSYLPNSIDMLDSVAHFKDDEEEDDDSCWDCGNDYSYCCCGEDDEE